MGHFNEKFSVDCKSWIDQFLESNRCVSVFGRVDEDLFIFTHHARAVNVSGYRVMMRGVSLDGSKASSVAPPHRETTR